MDGGVLEVGVRGGEGEEGFEEVGVRGKRGAAYTSDGIARGETMQKWIWFYVDLGEKETTIESTSAEDSCGCFHGESSSTISRFHLKIKRGNRKRGPEKEHISKDSA